MYLRFFGRLLAADGSIIYETPYPLDTGNLSLMLAAWASDMKPGSVALFNSFAVDDVYPDRYTRVLAAARTADDLGKVYAQTSDTTFWKLTAIGPPATYDAFLPVAPAIAAPPAPPAPPSPPPPPPPPPPAAGAAVFKFSLAPDDPRAAYKNYVVAGTGLTAFPLFNAAQETITVPALTAGNYAITGDFYAAPPANSGGVRVTIGNTVGPNAPTNTAGGEGEIPALALGTFALVAGPNALVFDNLLYKGLWGFQSLTFTPV